MPKNMYGNQFRQTFDIKSFRLSNYLISSKLIKFLSNYLITNYLTKNLCVHGPLIGKCKENVCEKDWIMKLIKKKIICENDYKIKIAEYVVNFLPLIQCLDLFKRHHVSWLNKDSIKYMMLHYTVLIAYDDRKSICHQHTTMHKILTFTKMI